MRFRPISHVVATDPNLESKRLHIHHNHTNSAHLNLLTYVDVSEDRDLGALGYIIVEE